MFYFPFQGRFVRGLFIYSPPLPKFTALGTGTIWPGDKGLLHLAGMARRAPHLQDLGSLG